MRVQIVIRIEIGNVRRTADSILNHVRAVLGDLFMALLRIAGIVRPTVSYNGSCMCLKESGDVPWRTYPVEICIGRKYVTVILTLDVSG